MKKRLLFGMIMLTAASFQLHAQADSSQKPIKTGDEWKMPSDVLKRSKDFADNLQKMLGLDAIQTKKVHDAYLQNTKPLDEIGVLPGSQKEKQAKLKANKDAFNKKLKGIFKDDQYSKYLRLEGGRSGAERNTQQ